MKKTILLAGVLLTALLVRGQSISPQLLDELRQSYKETPAEKALRNAVGGNDLRKLALNQDNLGKIDTEFTYRVTSKGITDQKQSGRCWLFTGLNVMRAHAIREHKLDEFTFSQAYLFFYDQLEKSNLFLQSVIDTRRLPMDDKQVEFLFKNPVSDGGTFTGVADLISKYGLVPSDVMPETFTTNSTARFSGLLKLKLREFGLELREMRGPDQQLMRRKEEMLHTVYKMLVMTMGVPPEQFVWKGEDFTPQTFAAKYGKPSLLTDYVMLMNDPSREYYKVYEIDLDRHVYEGHNWLYINLPVEDIKQMAIASLKDSTAMYFSCDVGKELNSERGLLDLNNYNYGDIFGISFGMDKRQRVLSFASGSSHAMTLVAVNLTEGKPDRWMVENSWGEKSGWKGHLIMTDRWFDEYMFRLVVERRYVPENVQRMLTQKPVRLPAWDPMFLPEE